MRHLGREGNKIRGTGGRRKGWMEEPKGVQGDVVQNISSLYFTSPLHFQHMLKRVMNILYTHHLTSHTAAPYVTASLQTCTQSSEATPQLLPQIKQGSITFRCRSWSSWEWRSIFILTRYKNKHLLAWFNYELPPGVCVRGLGHGFKVRLESGLGQVLGWGYLGWLGLWAGECIKSYESPQKYSSTGMCVCLCMCVLCRNFGVNYHDGKLGPFPSKISRNFYWHE